jgi:hypothetical protein
MSYDRKAMSAEPSSNNAALGKRWEDLIDAAASATEEDVRDLTPVSQLLPSDSSLSRGQGSWIATHIKPRIPPAAPCTALS